MELLELVKALAPYVTAIIAVLAAAFTAWLSHRNWIKQFNIQRSDAVLKEQIRLMQEVPKRLNDALGVAVEALYTLTCSDAFAKAENSVFANAFMASYESNQAKLQELIRELEVSEIAVGIYFGEDAAKQVSEFRGVLFGTSTLANTEGAHAVIVEALQSPELQSDNMQALIAKLVPAVMPHIAPVFEPAKKLRVAAIRAMASRINAV